MSEIKADIESYYHKDESMAQRYKNLAPNHTFDELLALGMQPRSIKRMQNITDIDYLPPRQQDGNHYATTLIDYYIQQASKCTRDELISKLHCSVARLKHFEKITKVSCLTKYSVVVHGRVYANSTEAYRSLAPKHTATELAEILSVKRSRVSALYKKTGVDYVHQESVQVAGHVFKTHNEAFKFLAQRRTPDEISQILNVSRRQVYHIHQATGVPFMVKARDPVHEWTASELELFYKTNAPHKTLEELIFDTRGQLTETKAQKLFSQTGSKWQPLVTIENVPFDDRQTAYNMFKHKYTDLELANAMGLTVIDIENMQFRKALI